MIATRSIASVLAALACVLAAPVSAQEAEFDPIEAKKLASGKQRIDPQKAYILVTLPTRGSGVFIKAPDEDEVAEYQAEFEEKLAKEIEKYPRRLANWEANVKAGRKDIEKPVEPTRENFSIGDLERRMMVHYGPQFVFDKNTEDKASRSFSYLVEVEPGTYTYYGALLVMPEGQMFGTCNCMGTVKFDAAKGMITNFGDFPTLGWADDVAMAASTITPFQPGRFAGPVSYSVPAQLAGYEVTPAELHAAGKINNFMRILVGRLPPVDGVLAYERDKIIDLRVLAAMEAEAKAMAEATLEAEAEKVPESEAALVPSS